MFSVILFSMLLPPMLSCETQTAVEQKCWEVTATAFNSILNQSRPNSPGNIAAWSDVLVNIEGYTMAFVVNDKMNKRFTSRIDLHLGKNIKKEKKFGKKTLRICIDFPKLAEEEIELTQEIK